MARKPKYKYLLDKSIQAVISAIEVYNKPDFKYREESFSILMVNAWETLLKAKIISANHNNLNSIYVEDRDAIKKNGEQFKTPKYKMNRAGNFYTIDIFRCLRKITLDQRLKENIELLVEIRDNAIHFFNDSKLFEKKVLEIGTASLKSYVQCVNEWFNYDLSKFNFYLMPISFFHSHEFESFSINSEDKQHKNLLKYISDKETVFPSDTEQEHNISLLLQTKFVKSNSLDSLNVRFDPNSKLTVNISSEEQFRNKYPMNWTDGLLPKLKSRYTDFKRTPAFWKLKKKLEQNIECCGIRPLDWNKPLGTKKTFYSPNILKEFDKVYKK
jgi:hypothetical protein